MKFKKELFLIFVILFITGCSAEYNLDINDSVFKEELSAYKVNIEKINNINIPISNEYTDGDVFENNYLDVNYYNKSIIEDNAKLNNNFGFKDFRKSYIANYCYSNFSLSEGLGNLLINTSDEFLCFDEYSNLTNITISITTNYKVLSSNAHKVDDNTLIWKFNRNTKDCSIKLSLKLDESFNKKLDLKEYNKPEIEEEEEGKMTFRIAAKIILKFLIFITIISIYAFLKKKEIL